MSTITTQIMRSKRERRRDARRGGCSATATGRMQQCSATTGWKVSSASHTSHARTNCTAREACTRARNARRKKEKLSAIKVQSCRCTAHCAAEKRVNKLHRRCRNLFYCTTAACQRQTVVSTANCTPKIFVFEVKSSNVHPLLVYSSHFSRFSVLHYFIRFQQVHCS